MADPAYLINIKKYARIQFGDARAMAKILLDLENESDRGAIILASSAIEDCLEWALVERMPLLKTDDDVRSRIFENKGPISTYSDKILIAYALGIIDGKVKKRIDLIRVIRNSCAHSRLPLNLEVPELIDALKAAIGTLALNALKDQSPKSLRAGFISICADIGNYIITGKMVIEDAIKKLNDMDGKT